MAMEVSSSNVFYPTPWCSQIFFAAWFPLTVNNIPTVITGPDTRPSVQVPALDVTLDLAQYCSVVSVVMARHKICSSRFHFDKTSLISELEFSPRDQHKAIAEFIVGKDFIASEISSDLERLLPAQSTVCVGLQFSLCSPSQWLLTITSSRNIRYYTDLLEASKVYINFQSLVDNAIVDADQNQLSIISPLVKNGSSMIPLPDLLRVLSEASEQWFSFGAHLKVPLHLLKRWKRQNDTSEKSVQDMLIWLADNTHLTLEEVARALCEIGRTQQAQKLCRRHGISVPIDVTDSQCTKTSVVSEERSHDAVTMLSVKLDEIHDALKNKYSDDMIKELQHARTEREKLQQELDKLAQQKDTSDETAITANSAEMSLRELQKKFRATEQQLDSEINKENKTDFDRLAFFFDNFKHYTPSLDLSPSDIEDIKRLEYIAGHRLAMRKALESWRKSNPSAATFRALLSIVLNLGKVGIAESILSYLTGNHSSQVEALSEDDVKNVVTTEVVAIQQEQVIEDLNRTHYTDLLCDIQQLKLGKEKIQQELDRVLQQAHHDESAKNELQEKLALAEREYLNTRGRLRTLMEELSEKTSLLEKKSSALTELEARDVGEDSKVRAQRRWKDDLFQMQVAMKLSQHEYILEIKSQIELEEEQLPILLEKTAILKRKIQTKETKLMNLSNKKSLLDEKLSETQDGSEEMIELQIEMTNLNILLVDVRSECTMERNKFQSAQCEIQSRQGSILKKKNFLPELSKCVVKGLDTPVHQMSLDSALKLTVHLLDKEGVPCLGHHIVTLCESLYPHKPVCFSAAENGIHSISFFPDKNSIAIDIFVDDQPLIKSAVIQMSNPPCIPQCTLEYDEKVKLNNVSWVRIQLRDQCGKPVAAKQEITLTVTKNSSDILCTKPELISTGEGEYKVSYMPGSRGECNLMVSVNDQAIGGPKNVVVKKGGNPTPLLGASRCGHVGFIIQLLEKDPDVNVCDESGRTALHYAARGGSVDAIKTLISKGAAVECPNKKGMTALHYAAREGFVDAIKTLIGYGAPVDYRDDLSETPLMEAAISGKSEAVKTLVENGANVNLKNNHGRTALHWAAQEGCVDAIKTLITNSTVVECCDEWSETALDIARKGGQKEVVEYLQSLH